MRVLSLRNEKLYNKVCIINRLTKHVWLFAFFFFLSTCTQPGRPIAGAGVGGDPFSGGGSGPVVAEDIELRVRNLNFNDARLYALSGGSRRRLGQVTALSDEILKIPWQFTDRLRIEIDLVTGPSCVTREFMVDPGEILELQIESRFDPTGLCR